MSSQNKSKYQAAQTSLDGYIRMTFEAFTKLDFTLRKSREDIDLNEDLRFEGIESSRAGYCEWEADAIRTVSVGWAWFDCPNGHRIIAPGGISTNVMLVGYRTKYDLGQGKTDEILRAWLAGEHWDIRPDHPSLVVANHLLS
jgi:hypothetical protein